MKSPLLPTKLYLPPQRAAGVPRPQLLARLRLQAQTRLILISAPAGYGKTTLTTAWLRQLEAEGDSQICWLALDEADSDPAQFFRYLAAAVQNLPAVGSALPQLLTSQQTPPPPSLLTAFLQDVVPVTSPFVLVLDDYHSLNSAEIDQALARLLDTMPPQMILVLTSRSDPGFPLSRLRARGQLIELRAADLRFSEAEAAQFLQKTMGLTLSAGQISALEQRTEGWVAGLQMAALSLQNRGQQAVDDFVASFTGSHRFVLDYLFEEALAQQSENLRHFLLTSSILDRLSGPLCDAVTGGDDGQAQLETLERQNLFLIPLDDDRRWYRYHHLFADVLQAHAHQHQAHNLAEWHRRASQWFAAHGQAPTAIRHALAAEDFALAAELLERLRWEIDGVYQIKRWLMWAQALPAARLAERPVLTLNYGWALLEDGQLSEAETYLQTAQTWLTEPPAEAIIADEGGWRVFPASLAAAHAYLALSQGDVAGTIAHAQTVLNFFQHFESPDHYWRGVALSLLGLTYWTQGDLVAAAHAFGELTAGMRRAGQVVDAISTGYTLAEMLLALGQLSQAEAEINKLLPLAEPPNAPPYLGTSDLYRFLSVLAWERGDSETAETHLQRAKMLGEQAALTNWAYRLRLNEAYFKRCQGQFEAALTLLDEAERVYIDNPIPILRPLAAQKTLIWLAQGKVDSAGAWAAGKNFSLDEDLHYLREFEHLVLARLWLARQQVDEALHLLNRLQVQAEAAQRGGSLIEIHILQALAHAASGAQSAAVTALEQALTLAEPQGYVRRFVNEGQAIIPLLQATIKADISPGYASRLLAELGASLPAEPPTQPLAEPLTERELEILTLMAAGLKNKEIAAELFISVNTVLYHSKNIYGKLGVNKRIQAVAKASEVGIL